MANRPIALDAYEEIAEAYASMVDVKPHNAFYERPATLSLLPDVENKRVLDAGCGPGIYSEWLIQNGAEPVAIDASPRMVELANRRLGGQVQARLADLGEPLSFLEDASFDLVLSTLVLEYVSDWEAVFSEFFRVLRPGGHLVVSVTHPFFDYNYFQSNFYFEKEQVSAEWGGFKPDRVTMPSFRRSLEETINPLMGAGFHLERLLEPRPTREFQDADPRHYEQLLQLPCFLCIRALKPRVL